MVTHGERCGEMVRSGEVEEGVEGGRWEHE